MDGYKQPVARPGQATEPGQPAGQAPEHAPDRTGSPAEELENHGPPSRRHPAWPDPPLPAQARCRRRRRRPCAGRAAHPACRLRRFRQLGRHHEPQGAHEPAAGPGPARGRGVLPGSLCQVADGQQGGRHLRGDPVRPDPRQAGDGIRLGQPALGRRLHVGLGAGIQQEPGDHRRHAAGGPQERPPAVQLQDGDLGRQDPGRRLHALPDDALLQHRALREGRPQGGAQDLGRPPPLHEGAHPATATTAG